jgi:hypothetical protein
VIELKESFKKRGIEIIGAATLDESDCDFLTKLRLAAGNTFFDFIQDADDKEHSEDESIAFSFGFIWGLAVAKILDSENKID